MKNFFTLLIFISITLHGIASNYFWVGGTGNYNDPAHWATTSGGSTFQTMAPSTYDDVFFDVNSFPTADDTVYFDIDYSGAHFFTISGVLNTPTFIDAPAALRIDIQGNFSISGSINWMSACELAFTPMPDSILTVETNSIYLSNHVLIDGDTSSYVQLMGDLSCNTIELDNGNFITGNNNLYCTTYFYSFLTTLYFGTSTISCGGVINFLDNSIIYSDSAFFNSPSFDVQFGIFGLHFGNVTASNYVNSEGCFYKTIHCSNFQGMGNTIDALVSESVGLNAGASALGANYIHKILAGRNVGLYANTIVDTIFFSEPGIQLGIQDTLTLNGDIVMSNTPAFRGSIGWFQTSAFLYKSSGTFCMDFVDIDSVQAIGGAQFLAGYNSASVGGISTGWQFTGCVTAGGVWPGDANYDLTVNNLDILAIGLANGETGTVRAGASYSWVEQPVADWSNTFASGINMKHADCDGNGVVDATDTTAVSLNYGMHHPAVRIIQPETKPNSNSILSIDVTPDTVGPSSPVHINVDLSTDSIYGVAFSVYYDPSLINPASLIPDFSNSWLGTTGVNMIAFAKVDPIEGRIDFALTRTDHTDAVAGLGNLLSFDLVTADNIPAASSLAMSADNVNGVFLSQNYEVITGSEDSTFVDSTVSVHSPANTISNFTGYISGNELSMGFYSYESSVLELKITDIAGRIIDSQSIESIKGVNRNAIKINLSQGIYIVTLGGAGGHRSIKVVME
jgi:hypothetical protein